MIRLRSTALAATLGLLSGCGGCSDDVAPGNLVQRITEPSQLVTGVEATGRVGDYVLDNGEVRFVVQEPGSSTGWGLYGGSLVDISTHAEGENDLLEELFIQCDLRGFAPERAEIVSDGAGGTPGILRLVGADAGLPFLDALLPRDPLQITMTVDLILPPTGRTLEIDLKVKDERKTRAREIQCGVVLLPGDAYTLVSPNRAIGSGVGGENQYLAAFSPDATTSYTLHRPAGEPVNVILDELGILPIAPDPVDFLANATIQERYFLSLGDRGDLSSALEEVPQEESGFGGNDPVQVSLELTADVPLVKPSLLLMANDRAVTSVNGDGGPLVFTARPFTYDAELSIAGRIVDNFELTIPDGPGPHALTHTVQALGSVKVSARSLGLDGGDEGPTPIRLRIASGHGARATSGAVYQNYVPAEVTVPLAVGDYTVIASRGPTHDLFFADVTVERGMTAEVEARVQRSVDTSGWVSADMHVHGTRSSDSEVSREQRVLGAAAEGVDVLVATDHDAVTDYAPTVAALGLEGVVMPVPGIEMSMLYGHMNGYPLMASVPQDHWNPGWFIYSGDGRFDRVRDPAEVAQELRMGGATIVQVNHPRSSGGVFGYLGLDATGATERPWPNPDAVELLNGKRVDEYAEVLQDVFVLLETGKRVTAVGTSDVHGDFGVGYGRTYVRGDVTNVWEQLKAGHAVASYGPFVVAEVQGSGAGETVVASGPIGIDIHVEAPDWMDVATLTVYENGAPLVTRPITEADRDTMRPAIRFSGTVTATPTVDSHYVVEVSGGSSPPILSETKATVNPILIDVEGDGWSYAGP
ncbi:MAG: CehA/McbA family metallohydrolase [Deltaproteobacteria bacterium]|jgi:N-acetylmuramoyl-L-alanine amidase